MGAGEAPHTVENALFARDQIEDSQLAGELFAKPHELRRIGIGEWKVIATERKSMPDGNVAPAIAGIKAFSRRLELDGAGFRTPVPEDCLLAGCGIFGSDKGWSAVEKTFEVLVGIERKLVERWSKVARQLVIKPEAEQHPNSPCGEPET